SGCLDRTWCSCVIRMEGWERGERRRPGSALRPQAEARRVAALALALRLEAGRQVLRERDLALGLRLVDGLPRLRRRAPAAAGLGDLPTLGVEVLRVLLDELLDLAGPDQLLLLGEARLLGAAAVLNLPLRLPRPQLGELGQERGVGVGGLLLILVCHGLYRIK